MLNETQPAAVAVATLLNKWEKTPVARRLVDAP